MNQLLLAGVCAAFSIFSKQDIGVLSALFMGSGLLFFGRNRWRESLIFSGAAFATAGLCAAYFTAHGDFGYWFNYGQPPHSSRTELLTGWFDKDKLKLDVRWNMLVAIPLIALRDFRKAAWWILYKIMGLLGMAIIIGQTSGQGAWTVYFILPWAALFLIEMIANNPRLALNAPAHQAVCLLVGWIVFVYGMRIFPFHPPKTFFSRKLLPIPSGAYARMRFAPEVVAGIEKVKTELRKHAGAPGTSWFLNMSEYSFLYVDLGVPPPRGTHLWYHSKITLFDKDYAAFKERLKRKEFDYILLQEMASGTPPPEFRDYLASLGYQPVLRVPTPKSGRGEGTRYDLTVYRYLPARNSSIR